MLVCGACIWAGGLIADTKADLYINNIAAAVYISFAIYRQEPKAKADDTTTEPATAAAPGDAGGILRIDKAQGIENRTHKQFIKQFQFYFSFSEITDTLKLKIVFFLDN